MNNHRKHYELQDVVLTPCRTARAPRRCGKILVDKEIGLTIVDDDKQDCRFLSATTRGIMQKVWQAKTQVYFRRRQFSYDPIWWWKFWTSCCEFKQHAINGTGNEESLLCISDKKNYIEEVARRSSLKKFKNSIVDKSGTVHFCGYRAVQPNHTLYL